MIFPLVLLPSGICLMSPVWRRSWLKPRQLWRGKNASTIKHVKRRLRISLFLLIPSLPADPQPRKVRLLAPHLPPILDVIYVELLGTMLQVAPMASVPGVVVFTMCLIVFSKRPTFFVSSAAAWDIHSPFALTPLLAFYLFIRSRLAMKLSRSTERRWLPAITQRINHLEVLPPRRTRKTSLVRETNTLTLNK